MEKIDLTTLQNKKIALVLSGGVVKAAAWHLGVSLALIEKGFHFKSNRPEHRYSTNLKRQQHSGTSGLPVDEVANKPTIGTYVGTSAGAFVSLCLASGHHPQEIINNFLNPSRGKRSKTLSYIDMLSLKAPKLSMKPPPYGPFQDLPFFLRQLLRPLSHFSGLFTTSGVAKYLQKNILTGEQFEDFAADLFIVATQLDNSRKIIFSKYNYPDSKYEPTTSYYTGIPVIDAVSASMSVPPLYVPHPVKNPRTGKVDHYIDGDIRETLSTHVAVDNKCDVVITSCTHTPYHYHEAIGSLVNYGLPAICIQAIYLMIQKKIITDRNFFLRSKEAISAVHDYCKKEGFSDLQRKELTNILEMKLHYPSNTQIIDLYPAHENYQFFFSSFFSLNPCNTLEAIKMGYECTNARFI